MKPKITGFVLLLTISLFGSHTFAAQFLFTPRAFADETYTDNLFLTNDSTEDDFITTVSAGFAMQLLGRTSGLNFAIDPNYEFYQDFDEFDEWGLHSNLRAWVSPSQSSILELRNNFVRTTDPIDRADQVVVEGGRVGEQGDTTVRRGREPYYRNDARLNYAHQFGREDRFYSRFNYGLQRNDDEFIEDNDFYRLNAGLDYWFTQRFGSEFFGEYTRGEYDKASGLDGEGSSDFDNYLGTLRFRARFTRHFALFVQYDQTVRDFTSGDENDYVIYAPSGGITYDINEDTFLRLGLGYYYQDTDNETNEENPFLNSMVSKTWNYQRGNINLAGLAGLTQNDFGAQNQGFQQFGTVRASGLYNFSPRIVGDTNAYYRYSFTPGQSNIEDREDLDDETEHRVQFNAGIGFVPTRWMNIRLGYTFNFYSSDADENYDENRAMLTITLQPDQPWRF